MKPFDLRHLAIVIQELQKAHDQCDEGRRKAQTGASPKPGELQLKFVLEQLQKAEQICLDLGWISATEKIGLINIHLKHKNEEADYSSLCADLRNTMDVLMVASWDQKIVLISTEFSPYVNNDALFGEPVKAAFPSAASDIREAGNCIATDMGTAAVFHLMRGVEWGLRGLCAHLGILRIHKTKKSGSRKYTPIEYSQWERMLDEVHNRVDARINRLSPGKRKQAAQEFYYPLLRDLKGFKDAWRNHVMHTRALYSRQAAVELCAHVKRFMTTLATKVSEP